LLEQNAGNKTPLLLDLISALDWTNTKILVTLFCVYGAYYMWFHTEVQYGIRIMDKAGWCNSHHSYFIIFKM
jgi:hypothetical protein